MSAVVGVCLIRKSLQRYSRVFLPEPVIVAVMRFVEATLVTTAYTGRKVETVDEVC